MGAQPVLHDTAPATDLARIKASQRATWAAGDFTLVARHTAFPAEVLCEALDLRAGQRVLDVATGSGNAALAAARRGAYVIGADYVPQLLEAGRRRAAAEQVAVTFREADAEDLPFDDDAFHVVTSVYGAMFAPDHQRTADELLRVTRPGGKIGLASWMPDGFWGRVFATRSKYLAPPAGLTPPTAWGTESHIRALFGDRVEVVSAIVRTARFLHPSLDAWLDFFAANLGPLTKTFATLDDVQRRAFAEELIVLADAYNAADDGTVVIPATYLEAILRKR